MQDLNSFTRRLLHSPSRSSPNRISPQSNYNDDSIVSGSESPANDFDLYLQQQQGKKGCGYVALYAFTINYIFGAGVLGIPYAVAHGGLVLSCIVMLLSSFFALLGMIWIIEVQARCQAWTATSFYAVHDAPLFIPTTSGGTVNATETESGTFDDITYGSPSFNVAAALKNLQDRTTNQSIYQSSPTPSSISRQDVTPSFALSNRRIEINEVCGIFLGSTGRLLYNISITLYVLTSCWMYASVFAMSFADTLPLPFAADNNNISCDVSKATGGLWKLQHECWLNYLFYLLIFLIIMMYLVTTEIDKLESLQVMLTSMGFSALLLMIITVAIALAKDGAPPLTKSEFYFDFSGFGKVFAAFVFSQLCHHGVPTLIQLADNKHHLRPVFISAVSSTCGVYMVLGVLCAIFFGTNPDSKDEINKVITLNWSDYTGELQTGTTLSKIISVFIRLFPAVTCSAIYPLSAITLGNSWRQTISLEFKQQPAFQGPSGQRRLKVFLRWLAVVPPILCATLLSNVSIIISLISFSAFIIAFFVPALLQIASSKMCIHRWGTSSTPYGWEFSKIRYCYTCLIFGSVAFVYSMVAMLQDAL